MVISPLNEFKYYSIMHFHHFPLKLYMYMYMYI